MTWSGASSGEHFLASNPSYPSIPATYRAAGMLARGWPLEAGIPVLMPNPPTVVLSAANAATSIGGSVLTNISTGGVYNPNLITTSGAPVFIDTLNNFMYLTWLQEGATWSMFEFVSDAPAFEWLVIGQSNGFRCSVNGQLVTAQQVAGPPADGNLYRILVTNPSRAFRRHRIEFGAGFQKLFGLQMLPIDTIMPAPRRGPRVIFVDNSMGEGTGATDTSTSLPQWLAWLTGWDVWGCCYGGIGYITSSGPKSNAQGHLADITANAPDLVVWFLGINDYNQGYAAGAIKAAALACYQSVQASLPNVPQVVLGPEAGTGNTAQNSVAWKAARDEIKAAALQAGLPFADPLGSLYLRGSGRVGATDGTGNADLLVSNDGTHPSPAGHEAMARAVAMAVAAALGG